MERLLLLTSMAHIHLLWVLIGLVCQVLALDLNGFVQWNEHCGDYAALGRASVILDDGISYGSVKKDGRFSVPDIEPGTYILSVVARNHKFDQLRIDISADPAAEPEVRPLPHGTPLNPPSPVLLPYPIKFVARQRNSYFVPPETFNIVGMFKNPMMLMMVFGGMMVFAIPYITKNIDPEVMKEIEQSQSKISNLQSSIQNGDLRAGVAALLNDEEPHATEPVPAQQRTTKKPAKKRR